MKTNHPLFFLLLLSASLLFSCSGEENDPKPETSETINPGLFENELEVSTPAAMVSSDDPYAKMATAYLSTVNSFTSYGSAFNPPEEAQRTSTPISAANARMAADYLVYEWTFNGQAIAYQYSEQNGKHIFEVFFKESGKKYSRYYYAEEGTDGKSGMFQIFNVTGEDPTEIVASWEWEVLANESVKFTYDLANGSLHYEAVANKDQSGSLLITTEGANYMNFEWNSSGNGSWEQYDENGQVVQSGVWTV